MPETGDAASSASTLPNPTDDARPVTIAPTPKRRRDLHSSLTDLPDEELILLSQEGEEEAFGEFVRRHTPAVHRWMARAVGEQEADDMAQEVFLKAYRGLARFRGEAPPRAWLASIADNAVKNRYRARGRFRRIFAGSTDSPESPEPTRDERGPEGDASAGEARRFVAEALKLLPAEFRMPVVLRDLEEWSYEEIATSLDLPVGTVKSRISRGRGQLRVILAPLMDSGKTVV
ncbi:MAG TPA: sigma-70 family RNA polymerase sigma factor [Thermoanaerobaculia bacterium]|nr:sigma-70 family RNA polymerase sigma factor [Thermoanaerobaculia bacterium]